jgi:hypothetical protein
MLFSYNSEKKIYLRGFKKLLLENDRVVWIWAKGHFFNNNSHMRLDDEIHEWLSTRLCSRHFHEIVTAMNGSFSIVLVWEDTSIIEVGIDRFGTIPIYYSKGNHKLVVSDNFWDVTNHISSIDYNTDAVLSMLYLGYVAGYETTLKGINEFPQAATHKISFVNNIPNISSKRYWMLSYQTNSRPTPKEWRDNLAQVIDNVFTRYSEAISDRGWDLHIPLSGGLDSRLIAGMFTRKNIPIQAFSYGPSGNLETKYSSQIADVLGFPLRFIPIDNPKRIEPTLVQTLSKRNSMKGRFSIGLGAQLSLDKYCSKDIYIPGHTGDQLTGKWLSRPAIRVRTEFQAIQQLINMYIFPVFDDMKAELLPGKWKDGVKTTLIAKDWCFSINDPIGSLARWNFDNRQRRMILSELRTYEQFGHWMLPYYDYELFDFFSELPIEQRYQQRLFIDTLINNIFVDDLAPLAQIPWAYHGNLQSPNLTWRDRVLLKLPNTILDDWIIQKTTDSKNREHIQSIGVRSQKLSGSDPFDSWWYDYPSFRQFFIDEFRSWNGLNGMFDVTALINLLNKPLPQLFIQYSLPAILTLCYLQQIIESDASTINIRREKIE